jgi:hypothetical protein
MNNSAGQLFGEQVFLPSIGCVWRLAFHLIDGPKGLDNLFTQPIIKFFPQSPPSLPAIKSTTSPSSSPHPNKICRWKKSNFTNYTEEIQRNGSLQSKG